jgi:hypothetical protein
MDAKPVIGKRIASVNLPSLSRKNKATLFLYILSDLKRSELIDESDDSRQPATTCRVLDLEDGKLYQWVAATVAVSALQRYPNGYVGKCFEVFHHPEKAAGKQYYDVDVFEIEPPESLHAMLAANNLSPVRR